MKSYSNNIFPPVEMATKEGLLAVGGDYSFDILMNAYHEGIFPWPIHSPTDEKPILAWFSPDPRGLLFVSDFKISKSLSKLIRKNPYQISFNNDFKKVIKNCQKVHQETNKGTWITDSLIEGYLELHKKKLAYSVEVYEEDQLVGGLYGVCIGNYISGESMFHLKNNTSKLALNFLMEELKKRSIPWLDTQMVTPILASLGGKDFSRSDFIKELKKLVKEDPFF